MKQFAPVILILVLAGCAPRTTISSISVDTSGSTPLAIVTLENSGPRKPEYNVRLFPKYESVRIIPLANTLQAVDDRSYRLALPALPPDQYRLVIETTTTRRILGIPLGKTTRRISHDFVIHSDLPASCFLFDATTSDIAGWTARGVYINHQTEQVSGETCPGLFYTNVSWPYALNEVSQGGSLFVPVSSECFPRTATPAGDTGMWHFSIVSPELTRHGEWQGIRAITFKMATKSIPVTVVPEIEYQLAGRVLSTRDANQPSSGYQVSSGRWGNLNHPLEIPAGASIRHIKLHIYGKPEQTVSDKVDSIFLDAVCPVK